MTLTVYHQQVTHFEMVRGLAGTKGDDGHHTAVRKHFFIRRTGIPISVQCLSLCFLSPQEDIVENKSYTIVLF